jgi:hypothetical protein
MGTETADRKRLGVPSTQRNARIEAPETCDASQLVAGKTT